MAKSLIKKAGYINGKWVKSLKNKTFEVLNPATGEAIATIPDMDVSDAKEAIRAANDAFPSWASLPAKERSSYLKKLFAAIAENKEALARLITKECGKPIAESRAEVDYGNSFIEWFAEEAKRAYGDVIPPHTQDRRLLVIKQPIGVAATITTWNFPLAMITRKIAPALAAGCTVIIKPPKESPLAAIALAGLVAACGFPAGVVNVVPTTNSKAIGKLLCESPDVHKISFTGSTATGKILLAQCAGQVKRISMELGGNAPFIVFDDADVDAAVKGAVQSKYRNSGQTCVCANRIYVQENIYDAFVKKFTAATKNLKVGNGLREENKIGPLINKEGLQKVEAMVQDAVKKGAAIVTGGNVKEGLFYEPTVVTNAKQYMKFSKEEIFGPVSPIFKFKTEEEVIKYANDTVYGLAAYFYSGDIARCWRVAEQLQYGMVGVNEGIISTEVAPFGGVKQSGIGREGSKYGMDEYMQMKYMCLGNM